MLKGCLLSLSALALGFLLLFPISHLFDYMNWPGFDGKGMHAGTWMVALPVLFGIIYVLMLVIDRFWRSRTRSSKREA